MSHTKQLNLLEIARKDVRDIKTCYNVIRNEKLFTNPRKLARNLVKIVESGFNERQQIRIISSAHYLYKFDHRTYGPDALSSTLMFKKGVLTRYFLKYANKNMLTDKTIASRDELILALTITTNQSPDDLVLPNNTLDETSPNEQDVECK